VQPAAREAGAVVAPIERPSSPNLWPPRERMAMARLEHSATAGRGVERLSGEDMSLRAY